MQEIVDAQAVAPDLKQPLLDLLLALADDEFVLGYWNSVWTGVAPMLEEDVASSSIAQDEIGHARLFYSQVATLTGTPLDQIAYGRKPEEYRHAQLMDHHRGDWAFTMARQLLSHVADQLRLEHLSTSTYLPLAQAVARIEHEEVYHQMHVHAWLERLAESTPEARQRLVQALEHLWPDALGLFEPFPSEDLLLRAGILTIASASLQQEWLAAIAPLFERLRLPFPVLRLELSTGTLQYQPTIAPRYGGRRGQHTSDFVTLWEEMTMVYRLDPQASW